MPIISAKKPLKDKLGDEAIDALIDLINQSQTEQKANVLEFVEVKFERRLSEEISKVDTRITEEIASVNVNIANTEKRLLEKNNALEVQIQKTRAELIKWMFVFWIGQVVVILSILFLFF